MTLVERVEQIRINPRYDMAAWQLRELTESAAGEYFSLAPNQFFNAVHLGFNLGYTKGSRAARKEMMEPVEIPKHRNEYRRAIYANANSIKNQLYLKDLFRISDSFRKLNEGKESEANPELDFTRSIALSGIAKCRDEDLLKVIGIMLTETNSKNEIRSLGSERTSEI